MKPIHSHSIVWLRHTRVVVGLLTATMSSAMVAGGTSEEAMTDGCCATPVEAAVLGSPILASRVDFCRSGTNLSQQMIDRLASLDVRAKAASATRVRLAAAGIDLLNPLASEQAPLPNYRFNPSIGDFPPGDRVVGPLRWTWASATWKF